MVLVLPEPPLQVRRPRGPEMVQVVPPPVPVVHVPVTPPLGVVPELGGCVPLVLGPLVYVRGRLRPLVSRVVGLRREGRQVPPGTLVLPTRRLRPSLESPFHGTGRGLLRPEPQGRLLPSLTMSSPSSGPTPKTTEGSRETLSLGGFLSLSVPPFGCPWLLPPRQQER